MDFRRKEEKSQEQLSDQHPEVLIERLGLLRDGGYLSALMSLFVSAILAKLLTQDQITAWISPTDWFLMMCAALLLRGANIWLHSRQPEKHSPHGWLRRYHFHTSMTAAGWGLAGVLYFGQGDLITHMFTVLVVAGIATGSLAVLVADFVIFRSFVLFSVLPLALTTLANGDKTGVATGVLLFFLITFLLKSGKRAADAIERAIELRYQNENLVSELQKEKTRVVNEAEHLVGTILANVPLVIWSTDRRGMLSFVDDHRIVKAGASPLPAIGSCITEREDDLADMARLTESALRGEIPVEEVAMGNRIYEMHGSALKSANNSVEGMVGVAIDITERKRQENELIKRANYDALTGLANRNLAQNSIARAISRADRYEKPIAIFFLDLDNFKTINDSLGHQTGDLLLCHVAERLQRGVRKTDLVARLGGDEFLILAEDFSKAQTTESLARTLVDLFEAPFDFDGHELFATASIGIAVYPQDGETPESLLKSADAAMYQAKSAGRNSFHFFSPNLNDNSERHLLIETELRRAIERGELSLVYQAQVDAQTQRICAAEALLRWTSEHLGPVGPDEFIPVAELAGIMPRIGNWVLQQACRDAAAWQALGHPVRVSINISPQQFRRPDLLPEVESALQQAECRPELLELEITESLLVQNGPDIHDTFNRLKAAGITLALDDFGTGYSALGYLQHFPLQVLKIDKSFIQELGQRKGSDSLVQAIIAMAQSLELSIVAEGVETQAQFAHLQAQGVDLVQGYLFSRPLPQAEFLAFLSASQQQQRAS